MIDRLICESHRRELPGRSGPTMAWRRTGRRYHIRVATIDRPERFGLPEPEAPHDSFWRAI